ncbi:MAG: lipid-A-disaccharide synthase, partial [Opitutae bacterium]|nr:lipid-A-disaccharide synthase [Opitutae bacterium]
MVVAGEASGDEHAAQVVLDLKARKPNLKVCSLGGEKVRDAGAEQLFPLADYGVVGLFEVLKNYGFFRDVFEKTITWIEHVKPRCILLVDYPGFNLRLARALRQRGISRKGGGGVSVLQYISPQLWAWKPRRRFAMADILDGLGVIFPFETKCYEDVSLPVSFVGHPFAHPSYQSPVKYDPEGDLLLLPGSRVQPVSRILPVFLDALEELNTEELGVRAVLPVSSPQIREQVKRMLTHRSLLKDCVRVVNRADSLSARAALMSSGTMSLSCA